MMKQICGAVAGILTWASVCWADQQQPGANSNEDQNRVVEGSQGGRPADHKVEAGAVDMLRKGRNIFRYDTFGDQRFWGDTLKLHQAIAGSALGGVGPGVSPATALAVGLKVDVEALPESLKQRLAAGQVDLQDPANSTLHC